MSEITFKKDNLSYSGTIEYGDIFRLKEKYKNRIVIVMHTAHYLTSTTDKKGYCIFDLNTNEKFLASDENLRMSIEKKVKFKK